MILGVIILKKKYNLREYLSILMITVGIFICTYFSSNQIGKQTANNQQTADEVSQQLWWIVGNYDIMSINSNYIYSFFFIGIIILTISLLLSSSMGIIQETLYKKYGKYPEEALFYLVKPVCSFFHFLYNSII